MARAPRKTQSEIAAEAEATEAATHDELPRYRVMERSFIGHTLVEEGAEIVHDVDDEDQIGENLSPLNDAAQAKIDAQATPHPDKTGSTPPKSARARADRAAAGVAAASDDDAEDLA